jgi:hypothetical protein
MDLKIKETGSGGDLYFEGGDVQLTSEIYNQPYLAHFGGNKQASTSDQLLDGEERLDYWANNLLLGTRGNEQFSSKFEKSLNEIELSSSGRIKLERVASADLDYLDGFAEHKTNLTIETADRVKLIDNVVKYDNKKFSYIWDNAKDEILEDDNSTNIN